MKSNENQGVVRDVAIGLAFWFMGLLLIRLLGSQLFQSGSWLALAFSLSIPIAWLTLISVKWILRKEYAALLPSMVLMTFTATALDSSLLTWYPELYSNQATVAHYSATWLMWTANLGLFFGWLKARKWSPKQD